MGKKSVKSLTGKRLAETSAEDAVLLQRQLEHDIPPRLAALQKQLEQLDHHEQQHYVDDPLVASVSATASQTELSLRALRKRLAEVRVQLYGPERRGNTSDSEDDERDDDGEGGDNDDPSGDLLDALSARYGLFPTTNANESFELVTKAEAELDSALEVLASPHLTLDEKLAMVRQKFAEVVRQDFLWRGEAAKAARLVHELRMQRQRVDAELDKANAIRTRLETLCRDLQAENRKLRVESSGRREDASDGGGDGGGSSSKSSGTLDAIEIPTLPEGSFLERETPAALVRRLGLLHETFGAREQHVRAVLRARDAETQLLHARLAQQQLAAAQTTSKLDASERRVVSLLKHEADLKAQVRQYVDKFRQVEDTLAKSNDLFTTFRAEMEQMSGKLGKLERENAQLHNKCATLSRNIIEMADERAKLAAQNETVRAQKVKLETLCRTLQSERKEAEMKGAE